jgi:hypothetical protein
MNYVDHLNERKTTFDWAVPECWMREIRDETRAIFMAEGMPEHTARALARLEFVWSYPEGYLFGIASPRRELGRAILEYLEENYYDPSIHAVVYWDDNGERLEHNL